MGTKLPRAGCPVVNLRRTLRDLTDAGLSVVVCEELAPAPGASRARMKERFEAGVVTPASPLYVYGLALADDARDDAAAAAADSRGGEQPPIVGVAASARGCFAPAQRYTAPASAVFALCDRRRGAPSRAL